MPPADREELLRLARAVLAHESRSYVTDAKILAKAVLQMLAEDEEHRLVLQNLTATQARCTTLLEEARLARQMEKLQRSIAELLVHELARLRGDG
jgi:hypothetical protein